MIRVRGNSAKSKVILDEEFDKIVLTHTLTQRTFTQEDFECTYRGGLYYTAFLDFTGYPVGEYKYVTYLGESRVQSGVLVIEPFDEEEKVVQTKKPQLEKTIIEYNG